MTSASAARYSVAAAAVAGAMAVAGAGIWTLRRFDPNAADNPFPPCLFLQFSGWYCPGCGTTRALHALVHGDIVGAIAMNPLLLVLAILLPLVALHGSGRRVPLPRPVIDGLLGGRFWLLLIGGYWLLRNLPWWPLAWMAPL